MAKYSNKLNILELLQDVPNMYATVNKELLDKIKEEIREKFGSLSHYCRKYSNVWSKWGIKNELSALNWFRRHSIPLYCLMKIAKTLSIPMNEVEKGVGGFMTKQSHGIKIKFPPKINLDGELAEGLSLYLVEGYTSGGSNVLLGNEEISVCKFFVEWLKKRFFVEESDLNIRVYTSDKNFEESKEGYSKFFSVPSSKIKVYYSEKYRRDYIEIGVYRSVLRELIRKLIKEVKRRILLNKDKRLAAGYIRGAFSGDGTVSVSNRVVGFQLKNKNEVKFASKCLMILGITHSQPKSLSTNTSYWYFYITGGNEFRELIKIGGFGHNKTRNKRLKRISKSKKSKNGQAVATYLEVLKNLQEEKGMAVTSKEMAVKTGKTHGWIRSILKKSFDLGLVRRYAGRKGYYYSITKKGLAILLN